jgi:hypothetical protein
VIAFLIIAVAGAALVPLTRLIPEGDDLDLPCPWCHAQTSEDDDACPGCGRAFRPR